MNKIRIEHKTLPTRKGRGMIILIKEERVTDFLITGIRELIIKGTEIQIIKEILILIKLMEKVKNQVPFITKILISRNL